VRFVARSHRQTAEKLSTRLSSPLPRPMPTMASTERPRVRGGGSGYPYRSLFPAKRAGIEPGRPDGAVGEEHGDGAGEAVVGDVQGGEADEEAELVRDGAGELVAVEIYDVEVGAAGELPRDGARERVGGEVEHGEVEQRGELRRDGAGQRVGGEVQRLEVGAVGELRRDGAAEGEPREGELVDAPVVAGDAQV